MTTPEFDCVIVGSGSAGAAIAGRLSEHPDTTVCPLEAGGPDQSAVIQARVGVVAMIPTKLNNWAFETVPQKGLNGRRGYQPRGNATFTLSTPAFMKMTVGKVPLPDLLEAGDAKLDGDPKALGAVFANLETPDPLFNIVTP